MPLFGRTRSGSWPVLVAILVVAVAAWGLYAWRFSRSTEVASRDGPTAAGESSDSSGASGDTAIASLRATLPAAPANAAGAPATPQPASVELAESEVADGSADGFADLSAAVTVNAPAGAGAKEEMTVGKVTPRRPAAEVERQQHGGELRAGRDALARGDVHAARVALSEALKPGLSPTDVAFARGELERLADAMTFSRAISEDDPLTTVHTVGPGESIYTISRQYRMTDALLASINALRSPDHLQVGQRLKIVRGPFNVLIHKSDHRLEVFLGDVLVRSYRVGLGANGGTPLGTWRVRGKIENPDWTDPSNGRHYAADDPRNPIGEQWIGLECVDGECLGRTGFGLHGTIDPASIGENMSMGCIRMLPEDIKFVYSLLLEKQSRVVIVP